MDQKNDAGLDTEQAPAGAAPLPTPADGAAGATDSAPAAEPKFTVGPGTAGTPESPEEAEELERRRKEAAEQPGGTIVNAADYDTIAAPAQPPRRDPEHELARALHGVMASPSVSTFDHEFLMECLTAAMKGEALPVDRMQRVQGIASAAGAPWPILQKPLGMPDDRGRSFIAVQRAGAAAQHSARQEQLQLWHDTGLIPTSMVAIFRSLEGAETFNIPDVEIFASGTWHGEQWTFDDLKAIARNFNELRHHLVPPLKIGHSNAIVERELSAAGKLDDSMPAVGWVSQVRVLETTAGHGKLVADFSDVPRVVRDLLKNRALRRVSAEIFIDYCDGNTGRHYGKALKAVALLGSALPEVKTLRDVTLLYRDTLAERQPSQIVILNTDFSGGPTVNETELKLKLEAEQAARAEDQKRMQQLEARLFAEEKARREQETKIFCQELKQKGVIVPAFEDKAAALLNAAGALDAQPRDEAGVRSFSEATGGKQLAGLVKDLLAALPKLVEFGEKAPSGDFKPGVTPGAPPAQSPAAGQPIRTFTDPLDRTYAVAGFEKLQKAKQYCAEHKVSLEIGVAEIEKQEAAQKAH